MSIYKSLQEKYQKLKKQQEILDKVLRNCPPGSLMTEKNGKHYKFFQVFSPDECSPEAYAAGRTHRRKLKQYISSKDVVLIRSLAGDILPPLSLSLRSGGFLFDSPDGLSISRLSPRVPRFFAARKWAVFSFIIPGRSFFFYADIRILRPSSRIFTAAFTSRSIQFPHPQRYIRSLRRSSSFTCPHRLHILLDGK